MNFSENDVWRDKSKLLNFKLSKLAKVLLKLEFDTKDQVLFDLQNITLCSIGQFKIFQ